MIVVPLTHLMRSASAAVVGYSHQLSKRLRAELSGHMGMSEMVKCTAYYTADTYSIIGSIQTGLAFSESSSSPNAVSIKLIKNIPDHGIKCKLSAM